jgi:uncharacterized protein (DUF2147 family)
MKRFFLVAPLLGLVAATASASAADPIQGRWTNPKHSVIVNVEPCGAALCGTVVSASGKASADARRGGTARLVGTRILSGLRPDGAGGYRGKVFLPKRNMHADARVRPLGKDQLVVTGCLLAGLLCDEQRWTRVGS